MIQLFRHRVSAFLRPLFFFLVGFLFSGTLLKAQIDLQITEVFSGQIGDDLTEDWFELENVGSTAWVAGVDPDLFYDDESASAADAVQILGITDIQPGEVVIVLISGANVDIETFRAVWEPVTDLTGIEIGLADGGGLGGSGDQVNVWIGDPAMNAPVDSETYPDPSSNDGQTYDVSLATFSEVDNANNAVQTIAVGGSTGTVPNIGSPGNLGPAMVDPNAPVITGDSLTAAPFLNLSVQGTAAVGSDLNDPTDPAIVSGIPILLADADSPLDQVNLSASSSNQSVLPDANLTLMGSGGAYSLMLTPMTSGFATITITATDPDGKTGMYSINYAVSDATISQSSSRFHYGSSDGSTAIPVSADLMWVGDDENQTIRLFDRQDSGMPYAQFNFDNDLGDDTEIDIEGSFQSGDTIFWLGSHTVDDRAVVFSTIQAGMGASTSLSFDGVYRNLRNELMTWDANNEHGLGAGYFGLMGSLEIEALSSDPNNPAGALLGFRSTLIEGKALVLPVNNFKALLEDIPPVLGTSFGTPILLDLENHTLRSLECNENGCLLIAGPFGPITDFLLYTWTGSSADEPELRAADLSMLTNSSSFEGIVDLPGGAFLGSDGDNKVVQLLIDTGTFDYYGDGAEAKDLPNPQWKKFRSELVTLDTVRIPPVANPGDVVINEIMQNPAAVLDDSGEWFELYNTTPGPIDLSGWIISDNDSDSFTISADSNLIIPSMGYVVLGINGDMITNGGVAVDYTYETFFLSNGTDELVLSTPDSEEIDRVEWDNGATFPDPNGASMALRGPLLDNNDGSNWCEAVSSYGAGDLGTPGTENDCAAPPSFDLQVTEIWSGQDGTDLTADWFEITNFGEVAWTSGLDPDLYYDDESQAPGDADLINGITDIQPGESVIVVIDAEVAVAEFTTVWGPDYDLTGIEVGWSDGAGLSQAGDGVTLFVGTPDPNTLVEYEATPGTISGVSYDVVLAAFSQEGVGMAQLGTNVAVATTTTAGTDGTEAAIGSPGNQGPTGVLSFDLQITEMFPGQVGDDLTADWFEIYNAGTAPWTAGVDSTLYYDDDSFDPGAADPIIGLDAIAPGGYAIVLITDNFADTTTFIDVWSQVIDLTGVDFAITDGSGLGGGGDAVGIWLGDPNLSMPIDTASYPDTTPFDGQSYDSDLGAYSVVGNANGAVQTIATAGTSGTVPNIGSPGNGLAIAPNLGLEITEIFPGQVGADLTADWFEITNNGTQAWEAGVDSTLYYDDESAAGADADPIIGITDIQPGETAIVLITGDPADITTFIDVWSPVIDLTGVEIGYADGAGLGGGGDAVTLWLGDPTTSTPIETASYPDTAPFDGQSYDSDLGEFSIVGNANGAVQTVATGGSTGDVPNIGSPGNGLAIPPATGLEITEMFPGQVGTDLTADWFEITNIGTQAWVAGIDSTLYYDDESASGTDADPITGIVDIQPGESVIILISDNTADINTFVDVWSPVIDLTDVEIGLTDGAGLGGGGDAVTLWLGDPTTTTPIETASYPDTAPFDGQSYDSDLDEFSVVGNANGAVQTVATGGSTGDVPNIGSPGNGLAIPTASSLEITEIFSGQEGDDLTADWFEITNTGTEAWVAGVDSTLYYDDDSASGTDADPIQGLIDIQPGETVLVLVTDNTDDLGIFFDVWSPVIDLTDVEIGFVDGAGLGGGGDAVTLWLGDPTGVLPFTSASYPDTAPFDGQSYDSDLDEFSVVGNANGAVQTIATAGTAGDVPNIGSPGNGLAIPEASGLVITEMFAGQEGDDLTADWFEIRNTGSEAWVAGVDKDLYYDDESASVSDAVLIQGITDIQPGESVIVLVTDNAADISTFVDVWSPVIILDGVEIGTADGAGLGGGGDAVTLWLGNPSAVLPIAMANYPDTAPFDGQSYDSDLGEFSVVGNANGAVQTIATAGTAGDVPNIGSPGDKGMVDAVEELLAASELNIFPNPTSNVLNLQVFGSNQIEKVQVLDVLGRVVKASSFENSNTVELDLSALTDGMYLIQVQSERGMIVRQVMKQ